MQLPYPSGMALEDWENGVSFVLGHYVQIAQPDEDWQRWGMVFYDNPQLSPLNPPNPYEFNDWILWGERLVDAFSNADGVLANNSMAGTSATSFFLLTQGGLNINAQAGQSLATQ